MMYASHRPESIATCTAAIYYGSQLLFCHINWTSGKHSYLDDQDSDTSG